MIDLKPEIKFKTARSGGKGGQHVNKVETMVECYWNIQKSLLFTNDQKKLIENKLKHKINAEGILIIKCQEFRTQHANKEEVLKKINTAVNKALIVPKKRKATLPTKASKEKRIESKKIDASKKENRKKIKINQG